MPEEDNPLRKFIQQTAKKLQTKWQDSAFRNPATISIPVNITESSILGTEPWLLSDGWLEHRASKVSFKNKAEKAFLEHSEQTAKLKVRNCSLAIPYISVKGKLGSFTPSFFWITETGAPQLVDVVETITLEDCLKSFWANEYLESDPELKKAGYLYRIVVLNESCKSDNSARASFHNIFMRFAYSIARRSVSKKLQVGAVVTSSDCNMLLSFGYNGDEKGGTNKPIQDSEHELTVHAECNSLLKLDFNSPQDKIMYVTHSPCLKCAQQIINANIKLVLYGEVYKGTAGVDLLRQRGVRVVKLAVNDYSDVAEVRGLTKANA